MKLLVAGVGSGLVEPGQGSGRKRGRHSES